MTTITKPDQTKRKFVLPCRYLTLITLLCVFFTVACQNNGGKSQPDGKTAIRLLPANPHYFLFRGKPTVLLTVGEHYSSLLNKDFDFEAYHAVLESNGLNQTRVFSGTFIEQPVKPTSLSPRGKSNFIAPWAWSNEKGGFHGYKFDLDKWNPEYFERMHRLLTSASKHGVVVEFVLFCPFYNERSWTACPMNPENNIQGVGELDHFHRFITLSNSELVEYQKKMVRKIVSECKDFDNVYFEICNEPYWSKNGNPPVTPDERAAWHKVMIKTFLETENSLSEEKRHMIAVNDTYRRIDFSHVSTINFHYVGDPDVGAMVWLNKLYDSGKAFIFDETEFKDSRRVIQYTAADARVEAWEFMIGGGSGYSNLALTSYSVKDEEGFTAHADSLRNQMGNLKHFIEELDLTKMSRETTVLIGGIADNTHFSALSDHGSKYVMYFHQGELKKRTSYTTHSGNYQVKPELNLTSGKYKAEWINPADMKVIQPVDLECDGGIISLGSPVFAIDIALKIDRITL